MNGRQLLLWPGGDLPGRTAVYLDDFRVQATVGRIRARWSHLTADPDGDLDELHRIAAKIGLKRRWFQDKPWPMQHYDVVESLRAAAVTAGAVEITSQQGGRLGLYARAAKAGRACMLSRVEVADAPPCPDCTRPMTGWPMPRDPERCSPAGWAHCIRNPPEVTA